MRELERSVHPWGTLEELLLACAVSRHGAARWDSVAAELLRRTSSAAADLTPETCRRRFDNLKRRFSLSNDEADSAAGLLVDRLTKIRVDELRRDLRRRDSSIVSLELKVKRLEEERETSLKTEKDSRVESSEKKDDDDEDRMVSKSDDSNRSFDESNSTTQARGDSDRRRSSAAPEISAANPEPDRAGDDDDEEDNEAVVMMRESNNVNNNKNNKDNDIEANNDNTNSAKQSSEVQSSSKRRRRGGDGDDGDGGEEVSPAIATSKRLSTIKSEPLIAKLLGIVRSHRLGSVFQRRLRSQESQRYKNMIRQHVDLQTIEARLEKGVYSDGLNKFFRDLLLLLTNAVIFFRKGTQEHVAAKELRSRMLKEMKSKDDENNKKKVGKTKISTVVIKQEPKREVDSNVVVPKPKNNKSSIIVTCGGKRNNSSTSTKAISGSSNKKGSFDDKKGRELSAAEVETKSGKVDENRKINGSRFEDKGVKRKRITQETSVVGRRGSRNNSGSASGSTNSSDEITEREFGGNELSSHDADKVAKASVEAKKEVVTKKKQGVASFLKRMKQNSPKKEVDEGENNDVSDQEDDSEEDDESGKEEEKKSKGHNSSKRTIKSFAGDQRMTRNSTKERDRNAKRGVGRPPKKPDKTPGKRGRETHGDHQPRKRSRR